MSHKIFINKKMDVYCTKKIEGAEGFTFDVPDTLPYIHIITPEVVVRCDHNDNFYIADCPSDPSFISNLIKFKKVIAKSSLKHALEDKTFIEKEKVKQQDDVIWIKPSPIMIYKKPNEHVKFNKMLLNHPLSLQLSYQFSNFNYLAKPYNMYNVCFTCDVVNVKEDFNWSILS